MKSNLLKLIFVGLLATIFTSCGSSGGSTAVVDDNSTAEAQAAADKAAAEKAAADKAAADKAAADKAAADKAEADRLAAEAEAEKEAEVEEVPATNTGNWEILPF
jgi:membrane protein involved in colicin uptake